MRRPWTRWRSLGLAITLACAGTLPVPASLLGQGTADIPLEDNAYSYIDALLARGILHSLSSLERPYSLADVRKALAHDEDRIDASRTLTGYATALRRVLRKYDAGSYDARLRRKAQPRDTSQTALLRYTVGVDAYATGQTSSIREVMLDNGQRAVYPGADLRAIGEAGPVTAVFLPIVDGRLLNDPQFMIGNAPKDNARVQDAYLDARWPIAEVFFGRESRNWGPSDLDGLLLGHYAYSYDHLYARLGPRAVHLQILVARLNDMPLGGDTVAERFFTIQRLAVELHTFEIALSEAIVYGGPGQSFNPSYLNPLNVFWLTQNNESNSYNPAYTTDGKNQYSLETAWRSRTFGSYALQLYLGDFQIRQASCLPLCSKPPSGGATGTIDGFPFFGQQRLFASYTIVSNLAYRNDNPYESYTEWGLGLGRGYSGYDEAKAGIDLAVIPAVPLKVYAAYRRQGQSNYLEVEPPADSLPTTPTIFSGIVSHIARLGVSGAITVPYLEISGDIGVNHATNYNNVAGVTRTSLAGEIKVALSVVRLFGGGVRVPSD